MDINEAILFADTWPDESVRAWASALSNEVKRLAIENGEQRAEVSRQHDEILHLRIYAPGTHQAHVVKPIPRIAPTNFAFYGMPDVETDFDTFGKLVPNETEL